MRIDRSVVHAAGAVLVASLGFTAGAARGADRFECGYRSPEAALAAIRAAVEHGQIADPRTRPLPAVRSRRRPPHPTAAGVPEVTADDIFVFEDSADLLVGTFSNGQLYDLMAQASNALMAAHGDQYDFVAFFLNFDASRQIGAAFYLGLENDVFGIGMSSFNNRPAFGVAGVNIEGWVMMWNQANWASGASGAFTQLVLGQEFEHRFALFINGLSGGRSLQGDNGSCGRSAHWNFRADGQGSGMEIAEWVGTDPATRIGGSLNFNADIGMLSPEVGAVYSYPDLYLMGYVSPEEMDAGASELRYMDDNGACNTPYAGPVSNWTSSDLIASNGPRIPVAADAQKHFRTGWVMIHRPGSPPTANQIDNVVNILNQWSATWNWSTLGRGTMDNTLRPPDCDGDGVSDFCEVDCGEPGGACDVPGCGAAVDCNGNNVPDRCEIDEDSSAPGGPFFCDFLCDADCNNNGIPDACDGDCDDNGVPDGCDFDCNANGITDACETFADCNANGFPDECDVAGFTYTSTSPDLSPIGGGLAQNYTLNLPPKAGGDVTLEFAASADLAETFEWIDVFVNGVPVGNVFASDGQFCPVFPDTAQLTMDADQYNSALVFGNVSIAMVPTSAVNVDICSPAPFIRVTVEYVARSDDVNGDAIPDECETCLDDSQCDDGSFCTQNHCSGGLCTTTAVAYGDLAGAAGSCGPDGVVDVFDVFAVLDGFQGTFAPGCSLEDIDIAGGQCAGDGVIDITDIFAVLDAFRGIDPCCASE